MVPHCNHAYTPTMPPTQNLVTSYLDVNVIVKCGSNKIQSRELISNEKFVHVTINRQNHFQTKYRQIQKRKILQVIFGSK